MEPNESAQTAAIREVNEEIGVVLEQVILFGQYVSDEGFEFHIFWGEIDKIPEQLTLTEGQRLTSIDLQERQQYRFIPVLQQAIEDYAHSKLAAT